MWPVRFHAIHNASCFQVLKLNCATSLWDSSKWFYLGCGPFCESKHVVSAWPRLSLCWSYFGRNIFVLFTISYHWDATLHWNTASWKTIALFPAMQGDGSPDSKVHGPTRGPPGSCRPQIGPMLVPWTLLSGEPRYWPPSVGKFRLQPQTD